MPYPCQAVWQIHRRGEKNPNPELLSSTALHLQYEQGILKKSDFLKLVCDDEQEFSDERTILSEHAGLDGWCQLRHFDHSAEDELHMRLQERYSAAKSVGLLGLAPVAP